MEVPRGAGALKFEDPRLALHMAAPPRRADAPERFRPFVSVPAKAGDLVLFESWLRHEVPPARFSGERISISFNYAWSAKARRQGSPLMRTSMRASDRSASVLLLALLAGVARRHWADCPLDLGRGTGWVVFSDHYMIAFRPEPMRIEVGEPFALLFNVCTKNGNPAELVAVEAQMPDRSAA